MFLRIHLGGMLFLAGLTIALLPAWSGASGFLENRGQVDEVVSFYGSAAGATVYFTSTAIVLDFREALPALDPRDLDLRRSQPVSGCAVWIRFEGSAGSVPAARTRLPGETHFFRGRNESDWQTHVPSFEEVTYSNVWPGIDLVYRRIGNRLETEAVVHRGADPTEIAFSYEGADRVVEDRPGAYLVETPVASFVDVWPSDMSTGVISPAGTPTSPEEEQPDTMLWCTYLGGSGNEGARGVAVAGANPVVTGLTWSPDFPTMPGAYQENPSAGTDQWDAFVSMFDATGSTLVWSTYLGGSLPADGGDDRGRAVAIDAAGNVIVGGMTNSTDFPVTEGAYDSTKAGQTGVYDLFVTKLDPTGSEILWSTYLGGATEEEFFGLVLDSQDNVILTGWTASGDFPTTPGAFQPTKHQFVNDGFVTKLAATGDSLVWSTFLGGSGDDNVFHAELDAIENVVIVVQGGALSDDLPATPGAFDETYNGSDEVFVAKLDAAGTGIIWGTYLGGGAGDFTGRMDLDALGNVVLGGWTSSTNFPTTPGAFDETYNGSIDVYSAKLSHDGANLVWSTFLGGSSVDQYAGAVLDAQGCPIVGYQTQSTDLPFPWAPDLGGFDETYNGGADIGLARLSPDGSQLLWNTYCGGSDYEYIMYNGLEVAADGMTVLLSGISHSGDFPTSTGAYDETYNGGEDAIVLSLLPPSAVSAPEVVQSSHQWLQAARPNPFRDVTAIRYDLPQATDVTLSIYDVAGRLVRVLVDNDQPQGPQLITWDARNGAGLRVSGGTYFVKLTAGDVTRTRKVVVMGGR